MMMINVPWHFKVGACAKGKKKNTRREPLFTRIIILKHLLVGSLSHKFKLDLTIILISQLRGDLIG